MNEGNIRDVLTSPNTDPKSKQLVAEYLISRVQAPPPAAAVTSVNSASATGDKNSIPNVEPTKTGFDNVVDKTAEATTEIVPPVVHSVATNTADVVKDVSDNIENGVVKTSNSFFNNIKSISIWIIIGLAIIILFGEILYFTSKKIKQKKRVDKNKKDDETEVVETDKEAIDSKTE